MTEVITRENGPICPQLHPPEGEVPRMALLTCGQTSHTPRFGTVTVVAYFWKCPACGFVLPGQRQ